MISSGGIVSREWAVIQSAASSLEINSPKWCTVPFGHTICTRQMLPLRTGNKTVQCVCVSMKLKYAPLDETDKPFWLGAAPMPSLVASRRLGLSRNRMLALWCATTTNRRSPTFISRKSQDGSPSCSQRIRQEGSQPTSTSCRSFCKRPNERAVL